MENVYKDYVIRYDRLKDSEWPNGCYRGSKYINNSADNIIRTKLYNTIAEVKQEIDCEVVYN